MSTMRTLYECCMSICTEECRAVEATEDSELYRQCRSDCDALCRRLNRLFQDELSKVLRKYTGARPRPKPRRSKRPYRTTLAELLGLEDSDRYRQY